VAGGPGSSSIRRAVINPLPCAPNWPADGWADDAANGHWPEAVAGYLAANRGRVEFWKLVNEIAAEELPESRWILRQNRKDILGAVKAMIHAGTIKRFRKRWLISRAADDRPTVPLDQFSGLRVSRT